MSCRRRECSGRYPCRNCTDNARAAENAARSPEGRWLDGDGTRHTVNPTDDANVPGGYYHSETDTDGQKATAVFDADGTLANIKQNRNWQEVPRQ